MADTTPQAGQANHTRLAASAGRSPLFTVVLPTFRQAWGLRRALDSVLNQQLQEFHIKVIIDGTDPDAVSVVESYDDPRIGVTQHQYNKGLGVTLNEAFETAEGDLVAVLPSDDAWHSEHLQQAWSRFQEPDRPELVYGGLWSNITREGWEAWTLLGNDAVGRELAALNSDTPTGPFGQHSLNLLKLVQVSIRTSVAQAHKWTERQEFVSDYLERDYWRELLSGGARAGCTRKITCEWTDHPDQRHKIIAERGESETAQWASSGRGLSAYRSFYRVPSGVALDWRPSSGDWTDENELYSPVLATQHSLPSGFVREVRRRPRRILLVGDLSYNPERILALEDAGAELHAVWADNLEAWNTGSTLPVGNIRPLEDHGDLERNIGKLKPDVIYGLLNYRSLPTLHRVVRSARDVPFIFHFKESPYEAMRWGMWEMLLEVLNKSAGHIFISAENMDWFALHAGTRRLGIPTMTLDGDLPPARWMTDEWSRKLSADDGAVHTVCVGRPIGLTELSRIIGREIKLHLYWDPRQSSSKTRWLSENRDLVSSGAIQVHQRVEASRWVSELSKYDAAWLHATSTTTSWRDRSLGWEGLNLPARCGTYAAAGLPWILRGCGSRGSAIESAAAKFDVGIASDSDERIALDLLDRTRLGLLGENMRAARLNFAFDTHVGRLFDFFDRCS